MALPTTKQRLGSPQRVMRYFALVMALVYLALGGWFLYTAFLPTPAGAVVALGHTPRLILGAVFVLYGLFRTVNAVRSLTTKTPPDELS